MITVELKDQRLKVIEPKFGYDVEIASDSVEQLQLKFLRSKDWESLDLTAQFTTGKTTYSVHLDENDCCYLPAGIPVGKLDISVFGVSGAKRLTTFPLSAVVGKSGFAGDGETPIPPTLDLYSQLIDEVKEAKKVSEGVAYIGKYVKGKPDSEGFYNATAEFKALINDVNVKAIIVDMPIIVGEKIEVTRGNLEIYSNNGSTIKFTSGEGFYFNSSAVTRFKLHDITLNGGASGFIADFWLLYINADCSASEFYNLQLERGCNGLYANGWVFAFNNFVVTHFAGTGVKILRSDNEFRSFYINGCAGKGLDFLSSNNRVYGFKILSCGKEGESVYLKGSRNQIFGLEVQDIFKKALVFENCMHNIFDINVDGIRTQITDNGPLELASFEGECKYNHIRLIASKYEGAEPDYITFSGNNTAYNTISPVFLNVVFAGRLNNTIVGKSFKLKNIFDKANMTMVGAVADETCEYIKFTTNAGITYGSVRYTGLTVGRKYVVIQSYMTDTDNYTSTAGCTLRSDAGVVYTRRIYLDHAEEKQVSLNMQGAENATCVIYNMAIYDVTDIPYSELFYLN